jgi:hypothetical protein
MSEPALYRPLTFRVPPERTPFQIGANKQSHLWKVPRKGWIGFTCPMWFWGYSLPMTLLGHYLMEPGDYQDTPFSKILHFIQSVKLLRCWKWGGCTVDHWWSWCKDLSRPIPYSFICSWGSPVSQLSHFLKLYSQMREMSIDDLLILFKKTQQHEMWLQVIVHMASKGTHLKFWHASRKEKW